MRLAIIMLALAISAPAASAGPAPAQAPSEAVQLSRAVNPLKFQPSANCPGTTSHYADRGWLDRRDRLAPRKLTELPPAVGYMAVYRTVNGCESPMTMVEYRTVRGR